MSKHFAGIAFTPSVQNVQERYGAADFFGAKAAAAAEDPGLDRLSARESAFLADLDGIYVASVGETGWPYVQFRGGPAGFVRVIDEHTIGWADFRGNLQYVTVGNLASTEKVSIIALDYARRSRLKIFGHARVVFAEDDPELVASLTVDGYNAVVERAVVVTVDAFDWNCPQHITPKYSREQLEDIIAPVRRRLDSLESENAALRARLATSASPGSRDMPPARGRRPS